ncbi:MAG: beta-lactamase family protein [Bacteroidales bacterium]|nr:beta-lactamase family protein [Bacteroidales bacterium]
MYKYLFLLLLLLPAVLLAQVYPQHKPDKALKDLTAEELASLCLDVSEQHKKVEIGKFADEMGSVLNGTMLISKGNQIYTQRAYGYRKLAFPTSEQKIADTTCFELASVSKQFTAAAVLQLVAQEKVHLNDYLTKYFPALPYHGITVHHLLSHTSGLPEYFNFSESWFPKGRLTTNKDVVDALVKYHPATLFDPGTNYKYINTNYALLALIVEQASGLSFEEYVRRNIFEPAGMTRSFYVTQRGQKNASSIATGHTKDKSALTIKGLDGTFGDKGLYSTVSDIFKWKIAYFDDYKILSKDWVKLATSPENKLKNNKMPSEDYGYGWHLEHNVRFGELVYHGGLWHGFHNLLIYNPEGDVFMIFLSNYRNCSHCKKGEEVLQIMRGA